MDFHALNALLNLYDDDGKIQFEKDREAANQYFLQHVNQNTVFFHNLHEKLDYLVENNYYDPIILDKYDFEYVKSLFKRAYSYKFRFQSFLGAYKYYTSYTLKTSMVAATLSALKTASAWLLSPWPMATRLLPRTWSMRS